MHTAITQPAQDNPGTFPEGPLKVLKIIETKTKHCEFRHILIKLNLRVNCFITCSKLIINKLGHCHTKSDNSKLLTLKKHRCCCV